MGLEIKNKDDVFGVINLLKVMRERDGINPSFLTLIKDMVNNSSLKDFFLEELKKQFPDLVCFFEDDENTFLEMTGEEIEEIIIKKREEE